MRSQKLHVLIVIALFIIGLRGLQVLHLFGVIPKIRGRSATTACALGVNPAPPFRTADLDDRGLQHLLQWLKSHGATTDGVRIHDFDGLRGLQATRKFGINDIILAIPTPLTVSVGTFSAALAAAGSPHLQKILALPDGDMYLEVVALLYEALLQGHKQSQPRSAGTGNSNEGSGSDLADDQHFGSYLASLPPYVDLPVFMNVSDITGTSILTALPHLQRLMHNRMAGLKAAWPRVQALLRALLKPSAAAFTRLKPCEAWQAFLWAYSIAQTRVVTLAVEDLPVAVSNMLQARDVTDVGVMVPLLDMANHGSGKQVNAHVMGDGSRFRLLATQPIDTGQQVFISYNTADDESPNCSWRWLLEYGFIPGVADPQGQAASASAHLQRQCYGFNLTAAEVASVCHMPAPAAAEESRDKAGSHVLEVSRPTQNLRQQELLIAAGLQDAAFWVDLNGAGHLPEALIEWVAQVAQQVLSKATESHTTSGDHSRSGSGTDSVHDFGPCSCRWAAADAAGPSKHINNGPGNSQSSTCVAACILQHILQERQQHLQEVVKQAEQQQLQLQHSCIPTEQRTRAPAEAALHRSDDSAGSCSAADDMLGSSSSESSNTKAPRALGLLLQVAYHADAALASTIKGLQAFTKQA